MCGIVCVSSPERQSVDLQDALQAIAHRGPDNRDTFTATNRSCHLGHVRLSIIDLSKSGNQPMRDASGRYVICYNGEVYNFPELKKQLESDHGPIDWVSSTDTEVIIEGFAREGIAFLSKLNGFFALAIYDQLENLMHVLRDPLGIKPLFITEQNGRACFSSELKGLKALSGIKCTLRLQSLADQLAFMYVPEPCTLFEEITKLEPGLCVTYRNGRQVASQTLFDHLQEPLDMTDENEMIERFRTDFSAAVRRQLIADVPISLMLSGGLDSSAVAAEALANGAKLNDAYTISFSRGDVRFDQQSDDLHYARIIAEQLGIRLNVIEAEQDFIGLIAPLSRFLEDGISDPAAINTYLICKAARENGVKVMLSGQGADEFMGGYRRYQAERMISRFPVWLRPLSAMSARLLRGDFPGRFNAKYRRIKRLAQLAGSSRRARLLGYYTWSVPADILDMFRDPVGLAPGGDLVQMFDDLQEMDVIEAMMRVDHRFDLCSLNLAYTDRLSMAVGVETRVPFLDFDMVRLMNSIPVDAKIKNGQQKYIMKKAMEPILPQEVVYREKAGFGLPIRAWMRQENPLFERYFNSSRLEKQGIFRPETITRMYQEQKTGKRDHANTLFSMLTIQIWLESQGFV